MGFTTRFAACLARRLEPLRQFVRRTGTRRAVAGIKTRCLRLRESFTFRKAAWALTALVLLLLAFPATAQSSSTGFFGQILAGLTIATNEWAVFLLNGQGSSPGVAFVIFGLCLVLQVIYLGYRILLSAAGGTPMPLGMTVARQLLILVFLSAILMFWPRMGAAPMGLFIGIGQEVTGLDNGLEPDVLAATAYGLLQIFISPKLFLFTSPVFPNPFTLIYIVFVLATVGSLLAIALRALMLTVEGHLLATLGPIPFAFSGFRLTASLADNYVRYAAKFGVEYMLLLFFVDLGANFAATWAAELEQISAFQQGQIFVFVLRITATSVAWALLAIRLPTKIANEFIHLWTPGIAEGLR